MLLTLSPRSPATAAGKPIAELIAWVGYSMGFDIVRLLHPLTLTLSTIWRVSHRSDT